LSPSFKDEKPRDITRRKCTCYFAIPSNCVQLSGAVKGHATKAIRMWIRLTLSAFKRLVFSWKYFHFHTALNLISTNSLFILCMPFHYAIFILSSVPLLKRILNIKQTSSFETFSLSINTYNYIISAHRNPLTYSLYLHSVFIFIIPRIMIIAFRIRFKRIKFVLHLLIKLIIFHANI